MDTNRPNADKLLEQGLSGDLPGPVFRARVLLDSTAAFIHARQVRARWRLAALSVAAVVIAGVSFLLGRGSVAGPLFPPTTKPIVADTAGSVPVRGELIEWLHAARFFKQLGMEDRVALAYDRASKLVPYDSADAPGPAGGGSTAGAGLRRCRLGPERVIELPSAVTRPPYSQTPSAERTQPIIAQSFGG